MCWYCGSPVTDADPIGRSQICPDCGRDLRCCAHCRFYAPGKRGDCSEPNAEPPQEKDRRNFCDWFSLDRKYRQKTEGKSSARGAEASARSAFDALFG